MKPGIIFPGSGREDLNTTTAIIITGVKEVYRCYSAILSSVFHEFNVSKI